MTSETFWLNQYVVAMWLLFAVVILNTVLIFVKSKNSGLILVFLFENALISLGIMYFSITLVQLGDFGMPQNATTNLIGYNGTLFNWLLPMVLLMDIICLGKCLFSWVKNSKA